jgi:hypothetical protein
VAPELAYVTARYAALAPLEDCRPAVGAVADQWGAQRWTVRNRTMRIGEAVVQPKVTTTAEPATARPAEPVVVGLDGGYVRSRHRQDERHFEVIAGRVMSLRAASPASLSRATVRRFASGAFKQALALAGVTADTPATVLCDGDAGL